MPEDLHARAIDLANAINQTILGCFKFKGFPGCAEPTQRAKSAAFCALKNAASQHAEDLLLLPTLLLATGFQPGVFVELGALDGHRYSNTLVLERCFNWTGLLIEPNPTNYGALKMMRRHYPRRAAAVHSAVCSGAGPRRLNVTRNGGAVAGMPGSATVRKFCAPYPRCAKLVEVRWNSRSRGCKL